MKFSTFIDRQWMRFNSAKRAQIHEACKGPNHPLFLEDRDVAILWSAKSGCTFIVKWFLLQRGELEQALAWSSWIHDYRTGVYRKSEAYAAGVHRAEFGKMRYLRLVRDPFSRAVSSYLHMVRTVGDEAFHRPFNEFLGRDIEEGEGVCFSEFCEFLLATDVARCDVHYRQQAHNLETRGLVDVDHVIHLETLEQELAPLARRYGLLPASVSELSASHHNTRRQDCGDYVGDVPFKRTEADTYPDYRAFYNAELLEKIAAVYREDIQRYGYRVPAIGRGGWT
ncbi:sulfotransferase family 2 domain-containing protein [Haliea sp. E17]|uniref:sulfotransferase family 2 domain-containing protein n=1 Tax=Haliea sp. E17 TaxID=3401576 RepID=UPI003AB094B3